MVEDILMYIKRNGVAYQDIGLKIMDDIAEIESRYGHIYRGHVELRSNKNLELIDNNLMISRMREFMVAEGEMSSEDIDETIAQLCESDGDADIFRFIKSLYVSVDVYGLDGQLKYKVFRATKDTARFNKYVEAYEIQEGG